MTSLLNKIRCAFPVLLIIGMSLCFLMPAQADTGSPPGPGAVENSIKERNASDPARLPQIKIEDERGRSFTGNTGASFRLKSVSIEGNRIFSSDELASLLGKYIGKNIKVDELLSMADILTNYYRQQGYLLSKAYIPPQTIKNSVVIKIREGQLGEIVVKGNQKYSSRLIKNTLKLVRAEGAIKLADLERGLLLLLDCPGMKVKATLKPGAKPGTSDLVINVVEEKRYEFGIDYNNFGSEYVATHRIGAAAAFNNVFGFGDKFSVRAVTGPDGSGDLIYGRGDYIMPLGHSGVRMGIYFAALSYELDEELEAFDIEGDTEKGGFWFNYPFIRSRYLSIWGDVGFEYHNIKEIFASQTLGLDKLRKAHLGMRLQSADNFFGGGITDIDLNYYQGFSGLFGGSKDGDINLVRLQSEPGFYKLVMNYSRYQKLPHNFAALFSITSQFTNSRLPSSEQMHLGGAGTVRGYDMSEFSGDKGFFSTAELRIPLYQAGRYGFQLATFVDYGKVVLNDTLVAESSLMESTCLGAGAGFRFSISRFLKLKIDYARSVGEDDPFDADTDANGVWYLQLILNQ